MAAETGVTKEEEEEEDDTMQNTVVLFSNTDKFVLLQVQLFCVRNFLYFEYIFHIFILIFSSILGHVRRVWQFWKGFRGAVTGLCAMRPVLPSLLCQQQSKILSLICFIAAFIQPMEIKCILFCP